MNWLTPAIGAIAAGIAVPTLIILYFLKLRRRDLDISTTLLWKKAVQDLQANAPFQRLRRNILLLLQLLVLAGVLFALAQPVMKAQSLSGTKHVILIDRSASMQSKDEQGPGSEAASRLDAAKQSAIALVDSLREGRAFSTQESGDQAMVIAFDTTAEPLQPFTSNKQLLKAAIDRIVPTDKPTSVQEAMGVALAHLPKRTLVEDGQAKQIEGLTEGEPVTIHLYSDGRIPDADRATTGVENSVEFHKVGSAESTNVGITTLKAERNFENPADVSIYASIENSDAQPRAVDVEFLIDGTVAQVKGVTVPGATSATAGDAKSIEAIRAEAKEREAAAATNAKPDAASVQTQAMARRPGVSGVVFKLERADAMLAQLRLRSPSAGDLEGDALEIDNRAWIVVPPAKRVAVAVVGRKNLFLEQALGSLNLARVDTFSASDFEKAWKEGKASIYDTVILDGVMPDLGASYAPPPPSPKPGQPPAVAPTPQKTLPPGSFLCMNIIPAGLGIADKGTVNSASIIDWSKDHPVTRYLSLDPLRIGAFRKAFVEPGSPVSTLATAESGPAILEFSREDTHAIIVPFDYMESNWPLDLSFVLFLGTSTQYLGEDVTGGLDARALLPGGELRDRLPAAAKNVRVRTPTGDAQPLTTTADGGMLFRLPSKAGVYEVSWEGPLADGDVKNPADGRSTRIFAANLLDSKESDTNPPEAVAFANAEVVANTQRSGKADRKLWPYLLLGALGVAMLEWFIYNRKVQI